MRGRAIRRHHFERIKRRVVSTFDAFVHSPDNWWDSRPDEKERMVGIYVHTHHPCSKYCCGNPRKHFGELTKQEKIALLNEQDMAA